MMHNKHRSIISKHHIDNDVYIATILIACGCLSLRKGSIKKPRFKTPADNGRSDPSLPSD